MKRLDSLDFLRGWASVLVVISHLMGVFWVSQSGLEHLMGYENIGKINLPYSDWITHNKLYIGQLGVAIFFLISGYVITLSLEKYNHFGFIINRMIRIYPVYIVGFCITVLGLYLVDFSNDGIPYTPEHLFIHAFIVLRQWIGLQRIDGISWTLEIELYFYIIMFIIFQFRQKRRESIIERLIIAIAIWTYISPLGWHGTRQLLMVSYMLLGYYFYNQKNTNVTIWKLIVYLCIVLLTMYIFFATHRPFNLHLSDWYVPYVVALAVFWIMINKFKNYKIDKVSKFLSKISYSLYVVHQIFGYALLVVLLKNGFNSWIALCMVTCIVFIVAYILHIYIEKPSLIYSKKFTRRK